MSIAVLLLLGLCAGSFVNALVWRTRQQERRQKPTPKNSIKYSILRGRSMCPDCRHELAAKDLIPVLSWLSLRGKCRYCKKPISLQYPLVELAMSLIFAISYVFWPHDLSAGGQWLLFVSWIIGSVGLMALCIYDYKWSILPNRILYPTFVVVLIGRLAYIAFYSGSILHSLYSLALSVFVASGLFWVIFQLSKGRWIGYGDVRLGLVTGTVLASGGLSLLMIFVASLLGCIVAVPGLMSGKKTMLSKIPFGPFLITATFLTLLFGQSLIDWYQNLVLL